MFPKKKVEKKKSIHENSWIYMSDWRSRTISWLETNTKIVRTRTHHGKRSTFPSTYFAKISQISWSSMGDSPHSAFRSSGFFNSRNAKKWLSLNSPNAEKWAKSRRYWKIIYVSKVLSKGENTIGQSELKNFLLNFK